MTIEELNKLIKEELDAFFEAEDDDIEVTTDEPGVETGEEALDVLRQIYDLIKPQIEPEEEEEAPEEEADEEEEEEAPEDEAGEEEGETEDEEDEEPVDENLDRPNYKASDVQDATFNAEKLKGGLNESFDGAARFKKLANIKG